jgi:hypothetical protein
MTADYDNVALERLRDRLELASSLADSERIKREIAFKEATVRLRAKVKPY